MSENELQNNAPTQPQTPPKKSSRQILILFGVFFVFLILVIIFQNTASINWVEDYEAGMKLSKEQNKPILFSFIKQLNRFSDDTRNDTYKNAKVIEYVEKNFVPILIDVDKEPELAEKYKIGYWPTHYLKHPKSEELFGPRIGYDPPKLFLEQIKKLQKKMEAAVK